MIQGEEVIVGCNEVDGCILECGICTKHGQLGRRTPTKTDVQSRYFGHLHIHYSAKVD